MADDKINLPSSGGGLVRYFEDYKSKIVIRPEIIVAIIILIVIIEVLLYKGIMGVKQEEIDASEVIIKTKDKTITIKNPQVSKVNMMGQESFQISGEIEESTISEEDIKTVAEQSNVSLKEAKEALEKTNGDLAEAILILKE